MARECEIVHRLHLRQLLLQAGFLLIPAYMVQMADMEPIICLADMEDTALFFLQCSPVGFNRALFNEVNKI